ncbi:MULTISPECIES: DUF4123 domain-containing protein [Pseudomonas]|uniref:DUF4123 domain-containing protein n=3 Tax=Pseudomonas syringae group TaxID=136849 RepID=Q87YF0_PSESM|nr:MULTISPECIES: DUF4123 domain-containing protein [Pseudomonas]AAO57317.1 hypothetical protein PSPTO_3850 [Pseudomonas syringae pv. tomato str. DC3000]KKI23926.1 hypothetical protein WX98_22700 [Pseudomonas syringae pv. persicae]KPB93449.1 Uncharacterized protein AC502_1215 [Pseudomonas syringae pv. maculicola]KPC03474.1 Uncharacterized protein AC506_0483 [Pseudomonas syringae pv. maculicola str. M6]KPW52759.1 Uncharacterized protein ALO88_00076 [Pseudomonas syringae pv. antirrhini]
MSRVYLLLDAALINDLAQRLLHMKEFARCQPLYVNTAYETLADCGPMLVEVTSNIPLQEMFKQQWRDDSGIWLESAAKESELIEHLRSLVHVQLDSGVTVLFRYYDPRITRLWLASLENHELDSMLGPIDLIRLPLRDGSDLSICRHGPEQRAARYSDKPWLTLGSRQLDTLCQAQQERFDRHLLDHCQRFFPETLEGLGPDERHQWAKACRKSAARHGYSTDSQVTRWVALFACLGANFPHGDTHAPYQVILEKRFMSPEERLDELLAELPRQLIRNMESAV